MNQPTPTRSWVASANGHADFPCKNLPLGIFSRAGQSPRCGVAIGDSILDLDAALAAGLFEGAAGEAAEATRGGALNAFFALGKPARVALRQRLLELLGEGAAERRNCSIRPPSAEMHLPARIGDYTDFYVGIRHAENVGKLFRPDNPLLPNYKHVPIGYHGRASTVRVSGSEVRRPNGQNPAGRRQRAGVRPCARLDYELELGIWIGQGNALGEAIPVSRAAEHIAGFCLLNDWSARDIQAWEYQPLGPFLSKSFITSVSPWVVTAEALEPFRRAQPARPEGDPRPLPYLYDDNDQAHGAFDIELEVLLLTEGLREKGLPPQRLTLSNSLSMYWTVAQMVAHHSVNGCQLQPGDLFGSGTLSGAEPGQFGSLLEITAGGKQPVQLRLRRDPALPRGRRRGHPPRSLQARGHVSIGFGECRGKVLAALPGRADEALYLLPFHLLLPGAHRPGAGRGWTTSRCRSTWSATAANTANPPTWRSTRRAAYRPCRSAEGELLIQSPAIIEYLEERYPQPALLSSDPLRRARERGVAALVGCDIHPLHNASVLNLLRQWGHDEEQVRQWIGHWVGQGLAAVEQLIGDQGWCFGDRPGLADVYLVPQLYAAERFGVALDAWPRIRRVADLAAAHPAFRQAHPANQPDTLAA